jgi:exodeoxyribonuclease-3
MMRIATWNVNSVRARLPVVRQWLQQSGVDVLAMQETKTLDETFPVAEFRDMGYDIAISGQKTYNGVAIASRVAMSNPVKGWDGRDPSRILAVEIAGITVIDGYLPHGGERGDEAFQRKLAFFEGFRAYLDRAYPADRQLLLVGDFNVAPEPIDVWAPEEMQDAIGFMREERDALEHLRAWGFVDLFRTFHQEQQYTWWDYRMNMFKRRMGMRIDHAWGSKNLSARVVDCLVDVEPRAWEKPSDHTPVIVTISS